MIRLLIILWALAYALAAWRWGAGHTLWARGAWALEWKRSDLWIGGFGRIDPATGIGHLWLIAVPGFPLHWRRPWRPA